MIVLKWNRTFASVITGTSYKLCYLRSTHEQSELLYFKVLLFLCSVKKKTFVISINSPQHFSRVHRSTIPILYLETGSKWIFLITKNNYLP